METPKLFEFPAVGKGVLTPVVVVAHTLVGAQRKARQQLKARSQRDPRFCGLLTDSEIELGKPQIFGLFYTELNI